MGAGALIGLWFGYTTELTAKQSGRVSVVLRIISIVLIYWSIYQLEITIILTVILLTDLPSSIVRKIFGHSSNSDSKMSGKERYLQKFRVNPSLLAALPPKKRQGVLNDLNDKHLSLVYGVYDEVVRNR